MKQLGKIILLVGGSFIVLPFALITFLSFSKNWNYPAFMPGSLSLHNWGDFFSGNNGTLNPFLISVTIALITGFSATFIGFIISRFVAQHHLRNTLIFSCYFPFVISPVVYALLLQYFFIRTGWSGTMGGVILSHLIIALPFSIILFNGFWNTKAKGLEEIGTTLGSNTSQIFIKILFPLARPLLWICFFQCFLISWFEYGLTSVIGAGRVHTLPVQVYQLIGEANTYQASLSSLIIIIPPAILLWMNTKFVFTKLD